MRADKATLTDIILKVTYASPGLTAWQIAKRAGLRPASVASVLVKLVRRGVLRRDRADAEHGWQYYHAN